MEVSVAVTLGLACERALYGGIEIAKLLWMCVLMGVPAWLLEDVSYEKLILETLTCDVWRARFADLKCPTRVSDQSVPQ